MQGSIRVAYGGRGGGCRGARFGTWRHQGRQKRQIDRERFAGQRPAFADLSAEVLRGLLCKGGDGAEATRLRHGRCSYSTPDEQLYQESRQSV